jgi:Zn-dependent protease
VLHLGSLRRTSIDVDASFFLLLALFVLLNQDPRGIQYALIWIPIAFISVLVHELAHAAMIGLLGFGPSQIVLGGMGGVTINRRSARPWQDVLISLAGPVSSFALMLLCWWLSHNLAIAQRDRMLVVLLPYMTYANLFWGLFNLIPVSPLDGGHAVRELSRIFFREPTAFIISTWTGIVIGGGVAVWMLATHNFFLAFYIAWFVYNTFERWREFRNRGTVD